MIRVFTALPAAWRELVVHDFRTQGAFPLRKDEPELITTRGSRSEVPGLVALADAGDQVHV